MTDEVPLTGGNVSVGVVRKGRMVHKPATAHTTAVKSLLDHLNAQQVPGLPRHHGLDDLGRQRLDYLPGAPDAPADLWTSTRALIAAARLLRQIHDASRGLLPTDPAQWAYGDPDAARHEVICHNDFAPYNMVFRNGLPTGVIDWDLAGPGPRLRDLAYLAYWIVPLGFAAPDLRPHALTDRDKGHPRLRRLCAAYGTSDHSGLLSMVDEVLTHMASHRAAAAMVGAEAAERLASGGHFQHWQTEHTAFRKALPDFRGSLHPNPR